MNTGHGMCVGGSGCTHHTQRIRYGSGAMGRTTAALSCQAVMCDDGPPYAMYIHFKLKVVGRPDEE